MKQYLRYTSISAIILILFLTPVSAAEFTAPSIPSNYKEMMPERPDSFSDGLKQIVTATIYTIHPEIKEAVSVCFCVIGIAILGSLLQSFPANRKSAIELASVCASATLLLKSTKSMIPLSVTVIDDLSAYGKLLLPVMSAALAAQGRVNASAAVYSGTVLFSNILMRIINSTLIPLSYALLAISITGAALGRDILYKLRDFIKWFMTWTLKTILYIFTGYISITGVISGTADAAAIRATKLTISGVVPVVGGILADASETILVSIGIAKNAAGIYGILALIAILIRPFMKIGVYFVMIKLTAALCTVFTNKAVSDLLDDFSSAMGFLLGITGSTCLLLLIGMICFLRGTGI